MKLGMYEEAITWCDKGLAVSFCDIFGLLRNILKRRLRMCTNLHRKKALSKVPCTTGHWVCDATCEIRESRDKRKMKPVDTLLFALFNSTHKHTLSNDDKFLASRVSRVLRLSCKLNTRWAHATPYTRLFKELSTLQFFI